MKIKLPKRCQICGAEFIVDSTKNELRKEETTGKIFLDCPICKEECLVYTPGTRR